MKLFLAVLVAMLACVSLQAQHVGYRYDAAGNRTERVIGMSLKSASGSSEATVIDDIISRQAVKIYPNPTKGILSVEIGNLPDNLEAAFYLSDMSGRIINRQKTESGMVFFDLSGYSSGVYLLRISINGENSVWKIIKE